MLQKALERGLDHKNAEAEPQLPGASGLGPLQPRLEVAYAVMFFNSMLLPLKEDYDRIVLKHVKIISLRASIASVDLISKPRLK